MTHTIPRNKISKTVEEDINQLMLLTSDKHLNK